MNDFKSYAQNGENDKKNQSTPPAGAGGNTNYNQTVNMATMLAKAFDGKSEGQIFQTILAQAEQGKRDGTLTNADLDNFYKALSPLLDGYKKQRLKAIIAKLKAI